MIGVAKGDLGGLSISRGCGKKMMEGDFGCTHGNVINAALTVVVVTAARMDKRVIFMLKGKLLR